MLRPASSNTCACGVRGRVSSADALPFADGSFQTVWNIGLLHHLPDDVLRRAVHEMLRVCKPGGRVVVIDAVLPRSAWLRPLAWLTRRLDRGRHMRTQSQLESLLGECGSWRFQRETYALNGGGDFSYTSPVKALAVLPVIDTGSGQGALIVGCEDSVYSLKTQITQRDLWAEVGFGNVVLPTRGIVGAGAVVAVNQDLYFRSGDGLRSIRTSTADYNAPGLTPLSVEVRHRFDYDSPFLLEDASVVCFDNRILCTHSPFVYGPRSLAQGIVSLNLDSLSGRGGKAPPCFDGEWDGLIIARLFTGRINGVERCFALGRDVSGGNGLWEILRESDEQAGDEPTQALETRTLFGDSPGTLKNIRRCDLQFSDIRGGLDVRVYFRPEKHPFWIRWDEFTVDAPTTRAWGDARPQVRSLLSTRSPAEVPDPLSGRLVSCATGFQVRVEWDGFARLDYLQLFQERVAMLAYADNASPNQASESTPPVWAVNPGFWHTHAVSPLAGVS